MSAHDETQRIPTAPAHSSAAPPDAPTTHLRAPGPLDLAGSADDDTTGVLAIDELFEPAEATPSPAPVATPPRQPARVGPSVIERVLDDAAAAWGGAVRRGETWLRAGDNALMVVTAVAAIVLILVIATFGG